MTDKKNDFDKFVDDLQQEIIEKELEDYNERIVELFHHPHNWGKPEDAELDVEKAYQGPCGDTMHFFLKVNNGIIEKANFITDGCGASVATGSQTTLIIEGKTLEEAKQISPEEIDKALHGLPDDHKHCAELAVRTLRRTIKKYEKKQ